MRAGVPVITLCGRHFASCVAAGLLHSVHFPETVTFSADAYEQLAMTLAQHPQRPSALRQKLCGNLASAPLYDTKRSARNIEQAFSYMWERHTGGLPPLGTDITDQG
ncbi:MAG: hypothetical protein HOI95_04720 [Chromatiales bacterium]|nr:hypothetical protein [Chromatiales bacterium]